MLTLKNDSATRTWKAVDKDTGEDVKTGFHSRMQACEYINRHNINIRTKEIAERETNKALVGIAGNLQHGS